VATVAGTYVVMAQSGSLEVAISPAAAVAAGAQWQVDGGAWQNSGATVAGLSPGSHTVTFSAVPGWLTPPAQNVTVSAGKRATATGAYVQTVVLAQPTLAFSVEGTNLMLSWSTNFSGFTLQTTTNLSVWTSLALPPSVSGTNYVYTYAITGGFSFFRLGK
jgi:hypothetical protein